MPNPTIPRDRVHELAEACSDNAEDFQSTATRLIKDQRRLSRFFEQNFAEMGPMAGQVALYMLSVCLRIFDQSGGRMRKVTGKDIEIAMAKVDVAAADLMPADATFIERAKAIDDRAQPHILDEILWALYERTDKGEDEEQVDLDQDASAMAYMMLWVAIESLDQNWSPPVD